MAFASPSRGAKPGSPTYLIDHLFIIRALTLRTVRGKFIRSPLGFFMEFFAPALSCAAHYLIFWAGNKAMPPGTSLEQFIWAAFAVWLTFSNIYHTMERQVTAKAPPIPGITTMHVRMSYVAWNLIAKSVFLYGSVAVMMLFGDNINFPNVPLTALILGIATVMGVGLGLSIDGICRIMPIFEPVFHILSYVLFITTGIYFSASQMPVSFATVFLYNPLLHLVEYERYAFNSGYPINVVSLHYPAAWAVGLLIFGLMMNRRLRYVHAHT